MVESSKDRPYSTNFTRANLHYALRAVGDATFIMIISMGSMWLFRIACAYLFVRVFDWGLLGVWIAMYVDWLVRGVAFFWRFLSKKWIKLLKT